MQKLIRLLTEGRALFSQITLITFIVEPPNCIVNRQIRVGDSKNVIVFDSLLAGHVIRRMRSSSVCIFNGNQRETLYLITQERIGIGSSNLVAIIDVGVDACGILSRSVGQTNRK